MLTFGNPAFLWALLALGLPVAAHLVNRERAVPRWFPSIRFIEPSRLPRQGRRRLRDLLLLLLRLLMYAAVILVLANPHWVASGASTGSTPAAPTVVFVDASASMGHRSTFNRTEIALAQMVETLPRKVPVGLVVADDETRVSVEPTTDHDAVLAAWREAALGFDRAGRPATGLAEAARIVSASGEDRLVIVSDFQASDWQNAAAPGLTDGVALDFIPVGPEPWENVVLLSAQVVPAQDGGLRVFTRIRNDGASALPIRVVLENSATSAETTLDPDATELLTLHVPPEAVTPEGRPAVLQLRVVSEESWPEGNLYTADDAYHFWMGAPPPVRVVALLPMDDEPEKAREAAFLRRALEVGDDRPGARFEFALADPTSAAWLDTADVLYLPGTGAYFDEAAWQRVRAFVERGGVVFATPGKSAPRLFRGLREAGLSGTAYTGKPRPASPRSPYRIGELPATGPLARVFDEESRDDLYRAEIYEYWRTQPGDATEVLLATEDGDPLLMRERAGRGAVLLSAVALDPAASDLPLRNAFVPLLWETLRPSQGESGPRRLTVGEAWPADLPDRDESQSTDAPGALLVAGTPVEINVARSESLPRTVALADVRGQVLARQSTVAAAVTDSGMLPGQSLWPGLATVALLAVALEMLVAGWPDRREAVAA